MGLEGLGKKRVAWRHILYLLLVGGFIATPPSVNAANLGTGPAGSADRSSSTELTGGWHLVRTRNPQGGADTVFILHTADTSRSDLDFAGLMIRCHEGAAEAVIILLRPFPPHARLQIMLGKPGNEIHFEATIAPPGTAILIPRDAASLVRGPWHALNELFIRVQDSQPTIRGVVALTGLQSAFNVLLASCRAR